MADSKKEQEITKAEKELNAFILDMVQKGKEIERMERLKSKGFTVSNVYDEEMEEIIIDLRGRR
jgi:hypothetical protein